MHRINLPGLMFLTSPNGGLAHYVVHLWKHISVNATPMYVTYSSPRSDELVRENITDIYPLIDPKDFKTIEEVIRLVLRRDIRFVNLHSGTRAKLEHRYFTELLKRLRQIGIKLILHLHNASIFKTSPEDLHASVALCRLCDSILVGSPREMEFVQRISGMDNSRIFLMHHGPYSMMNSGRFDRDSARQYLRLDPDAPVVLSFGYLRQEKRLDDLFAAFRMLKHRLPRSVLLVQSHVQYKPAWKEWLETQALNPGVQVSTGYASLRDIEALFQAADVVALPYENTAASGVLNLARAFARPVIVTSRFDTANAIHDTCGYSISAGEPDALADALTRLLAMPESERRRMAEGWKNILAEENWVNASEVLWNACLSAAESTDMPRAKTGIEQYG